MVHNGHMDIPNDSFDEGLLGVCWEERGSKNILYLYFIMKLFGNVRYTCILLFGPVSKPVRNHLINDIFIN